MYCGLSPCGASKHSSSHKYHQYCGMTLLELLVTLAIASLLLSIALPAFSHSIRQFSNTVLTNRLIGLVHYARLEAITHHRTITLCGTEDNLACHKNWSRGVLVFLDKNKNGRREQNEQLLQIADINRPGDSLTWRSFRNKSYLQLHPDGLTYYQNGNFTYCPADGDERYGLHWIMNISGHLRLAKDNNADGILEKSNGNNIDCGQ